VARDITRFARYLLVEHSDRMDDAGYDGGSFVPQKPTCLN
jgi:hypothetical protein